MNYIDQFCSAIEAAGLSVPDLVQDDGLLHRWNGTGKRGNKRNSWYVLYPDGIPSGSFGDWSLMLSEKWCSRSDNDMTQAERQAIRDRVRAAQLLRDQEIARNHGQTAIEAVEMWNRAVPAVAHPYLTAKDVKPHGLRVDGSLLLIPLRDSAGKLWSLQSIDVRGEKRYLPGGKVKGCYHSIGRPSGRVIIGEGYATCATVHEATGDAVAVAFDAGNLEPVARALRAKYPCLSIVIAADDDFETRHPVTGELTNPGLAFARKAAAAVGGTVAIPDFTGLDRGSMTDFNDLARLAGAIKMGGAA